MKDIFKSRFYFNHPFCELNIEVLGAGYKNHNISKIKTQFFTISQEKHLKKYKFVCLLPSSK